jgi:hypothetical protein
MSTERTTSSKKGKTPRLKRDDPAQSRLFIQKAREVGADEESSVSDALLGALAKRPPEPRKKKAKKV